MMKPKLLVALAAVASVALFTFKLHGQADTSPDAPAEPVGGPTQYVGELPPPRTGLEKVAAATDVVVTKGYTRVGEVAGDDGSTIRISAVEVGPTDNGDKVRGLLVQVQQARGVARSAISYVDENELDRLIDAVQKLAKLQPENNRLTDLDASFRTAGDLEVINVNNNGARMAGVRCTQLLRPSGQIVWATSTFGLNRLELLQHQLEAGKQAIDALKTAEK